MVDKLATGQAVFWGRPYSITLLGGTSYHYVGKRPWNNIICLILRSLAQILSVIYSEVEMYLNLRRLLHTPTSAM